MSIQCLAATCNICIEQGTTWKPALRVTEQTTGSPVDITGWDFRMQIREDDQDGAIIIELTVANGRINILDATDGVFELRILDTETDAFTEAQFEDAVYDLEGIDSLGDVMRLMQGRATLSLNITRTP